ncbi:Ig-like domain-containing protein [Peribacillus asahii]|uniref:Ig-like domain-containing protein n=1 Tax=Peribacillus asahii TaxID=228899 RepID=UPI0037FA5D96
MSSIKSTSIYISGTTKTNVSVEVLDSKNKVIAKGTSDSKVKYKIKMKKQKKNSYLKLKVKDSVGN